KSYAGSYAVHGISIAHSMHRSKFRERRNYRRKTFIRNIQHREAAESSLRISAYDPVRPGESIGRHAEQPLRQSKLRRHRRQRPHRSRCEIEEIKVPPAGAIGHEDDLPAVRGPFRLEDRLLGPARDGFDLFNSAIANHFAEVELRAVPRHVGMIPCKPCEPSS